MGYMRHHAIVVSSWDGALIVKARAKAEKAFSGVTEVSKVTSGAINGYRSFFVAPDGSKEGWGDSDLGDEARDSFILWLRQQVETDGSSCIKWIEVQFGDDEGKTRVLQHSEDDKFCEGGTR